MNLYMNYIFFFVYFKNFNSQLNINYQKNVPSVLYLFRIAFPECTIL